MEKIFTKIANQSMHVDGEVYSCTFSHADDYQFYTTNAMTRYRLWYKQLKADLEALEDQGCEYILFPEIGKKTYRLHVHGVIKFNNIVVCQLGILPKIQYKFRKGNKVQRCNIDIDTINVKETWDAYIQKDISTMRPFVKSLGLPYPITSQSLIGTEALELTRKPRAEGSPKGILPVS